MSSPWSSGADSSSIWNSNSPNLNLLRRYSLRSSSAADTSASASNSSCSWEASADNKYLIGYIMISRQDLDIYHATLGFQICGGKQTEDGHYGAIVEHVVPGSLMNVVCKLKVGDEIVEWNGFNLRNKRNEEVCDIIESVKSTNSLRLVAIRLTNNNVSSNNGASNSNNTNTNTATNTNSSGNNNNNNNSNNPNGSNMSASSNNNSTPSN